MNKIKLWFKSQLPLLLVIIIAFSIRNIGSNWDRGTYMHPDERFVAMVVDRIKMPETFADYMDPAKSTLSPFNNEYKFYVYGGFPILLAKATMVTIDQSFPQPIKYDNYGSVYIVGRFYNTVFDIGTLILVYSITKKLFNKETGIIAALIYSLTVMIIQQSNFFTMDLFAVFFLMLTLKIFIDFYYSKNINLQFLFVLIAGLALGGALASKFSSLMFAPLGILFIIIGLIRELKPKLKAYKHNLIMLSKYLLLAAIFVCFSYLSFRLLQPFIFVDSNIFNPELNKDFLDAMDYQYKLGNGTVTAPFTIQWYTTTPIITPFVNLAVWGLGIPLTISIFGGIVLLIIENIKLIKSRKFKLIFSDSNFIQLVILGFAGAAFIYLGIGFIKYLRYFLPIVPILVIFAAKFITMLSHKGKTTYKISLLLLVAIQLYTLAFLSIYLSPHTKFSASKWFMANVPENSNVSHEIWDDFIPIDVDGIHKNYNGQEVDMYRDDNDEKIPYLYEYLTKTDYITLASSRQSKSVGALPDRYPMTTKFYQALANGKLGYTLVHKEGSYPRILGIEMNDEWAEESFFIYDHPTIWIYKKDKQLELEEFTNLLIN